MRGIISQMHKRKLTAKITLRGYRRIETFPYFFFVSFLYRVIKGSKEKNKHKNMRNTYHKLTSLRVSLLFLLI